MQRARSSSWSIASDMDTGLQFASFLGQQLRLSPLSPEESPESIHTEWLHWWKQLEIHTLSQIAYAVESQLPDRSPAEHLAVVASRVQQTYQPPHFPHLQATPRLQEAAQVHWPAFQQWWEAPNGAKSQFTTRMHHALHTIALASLVTDCVKAKGKRQSHPFHLALEFVTWPEEYVAWREPALLILGAAYLEPSQRLHLQQHLVAALQGLV